MAEPQITEIASYFATRLPDEGVDTEVTRNGWRHALRLARKQGNVDWLVDFVTREAPDDATVEAYCEALRR
jgi:hypothetical protein